MPLAWAAVARCRFVFGSVVIACAASQLCVAAQSGLSAQPRKSAASAPAPETQQFASAMAAYRAGRYSEALTTLQRLLRTHPESPDTNELTGLALAATGQHERANPYLAKAVRLAPAIAAWRTALAINLVELRRNVDAESQFRRVVEMSPDDYDAAHNLGEFYVRTGRLREAVPYLSRAHELRPADYNNGYDLALALVQVSELKRARQQVLALIQMNDQAELHSLLGTIEEKDGNYIAAAREHELAARMDPSEGNIFAWGAELLLHQTFDPAVAVFQAGLDRFPDSTRLQLGLGIALYGNGRADDAARKFCEVWDRDPSDPLALTFAGKTYDVLSADVADQVRSRLARFVKNDRRNAVITYYYATALWREHQQNPETVPIAEIVSLLTTAAALQPDYADAFLQLGIVYAQQEKYAEAVRQYEKAVRIAPDVASTHYRLGQVLARMGDKSRARQELATYERLRKQEAADTETQRAEIQQFVYTMRSAGATAAKQNE